MGTKLATGQPDAALDGIYKLGAIRRPGGEWQYRIKLSEESAKASVPGSLQVRRFYQPDGRFMADAIYETDHGVSEPCEIVDVETEGKTKIPRNTRYSDLLVPIFRAGQLVYEAPSIEASREHRAQTAQLRASGDFAAEGSGALQDRPRTIIARAKVVA